MSFKCFTQCEYNATVQAIIDYSAAIWGTKSISSIKAVQNRVRRYFLGLGRYAPNALLTLYDPGGGGALKAPPPPPIVCPHAFYFGATLLCVGDFSKKNS